MVNKEKLKKSFMIALKNGIPYFILGYILGQILIWMGYL